MVKKYAWNQFDTLQTAAEFDEYFEEQKYSHSQYCHYTSLRTINSILHGKTFRLSNVGGFNDKWDCAQFAQSNKYFSLCFATGVNENLSLWYLYSGMNGQGGRIRLTDAQFRRLADCNAFILCEADKDGNKIREVCKLEPNKSIKITVSDVLYYRERPDKDVCDLKYNTMTHHKFPKEELHKYQKSHNGFSKGLIWYFEKETRILAELIGYGLENIEPGKSYFIEMPIHKRVMNNLKIDLAPEISAENAPTILKSYDNVKQLFDESSRVNLSEFAGSIEMKLCNKCEKAKKN